MSQTDPDLSLSKLTTNSSFNSINMLSYYGNQMVIYRISSTESEYLLKYSPQSGSSKWTKTFSPILVGDDGTPATSVRYTGPDDMTGTSYSEEFVPAIRYRRPKTSGISTYVTNKTYPCRRVYPVFYNINNGNTIFYSRNTSVLTSACTLQGVISGLSNYATGDGLTLTAAQAGRSSIFSLFDAEADGDTPYFHDDYDNITYIPGAYYPNGTTFTFQPAEGRHICRRGWSVKAGLPAETEDDDVEYSTQTLSCLEEYPTTTNSDGRMLPLFVWRNGDCSFRLVGNVINQDTPTFTLKHIYIRNEALYYKQTISFGMVVPALSVDVGGGTVTTATYGSATLSPQSEKDIYATSGYNSSLYYTTFNKYINYLVNDSSGSYKSKMCLWLKCESSAAWTGRDDSYSQTFYFQPTYNSTDTTGTRSYKTLTNNSTTWKGYVWAVQGPIAYWKSLGTSSHYSVTAGRSFVRDQEQQGYYSTRTYGSTE